MVGRGFVVVTVESNKHTARNAAADTFAANVLPVVRQLQAIGVTTTRALAEVLTVRGRRAGGEGAGTSPVFLCRVTAPC
jgi:hypothetical protein